MNEATTTSSTTSSADGGISYDQAIEEIEEILSDLENSVTDVDHLAERVKRATLLLSICRDRLGVVENDVQQLVATLGDPGADPA